MAAQKILLIDDEATLTKMVKLNLERAGDFEVFTENSGPAAISTIRRCQPDLIFLDIMMPKKSGDDVAQEMRQDKDLATIPIVFLTAMVSKDETGVLGSLIGGNRFLAKPVKTDELLDIISEILG
jgi:DNA-binding response OmpR family regulator